MSRLFSSILPTSFSGRATSPTPLTEQQAAAGQPRYPELTPDLKKADAQFRSRTPGFLRKHFDKYREREAAQNRVFDSLNEMHWLIAARTQSTSGNPGPYGFNPETFRIQAKIFMLRLGIDAERTDTEEFVRLVEESKEKLNCLHLPDLKHIAKVMGSKIAPGPLKIFFLSDDVGANDAIFRLPHLSDQIYEERPAFGDKAARRAYPDEYKEALNHFMSGVERMKSQAPIDPEQARERIEALQDRLPPGHP